ncbi:phosphatase PAP2 family protein [Streptomyces galbus]|uniref:Phosphatase PAP2 family protein n=1 Tax=Streptomyces galbus TaxID=33898 RepID=A0A4U5WXE5_STRGB|nr:phosphatase PAP2 family protein [Streptomyces galbus]TKT06572.1 phosphatase PAP2 family protein [Streptomyces galbus]GHD54180.1 hypothetical protein GCM10010335_68380 [Streptomyces galbus]
MKLLDEVRDTDRAMTKQAASRAPAPAGKTLSALERAARSSKLWCAAALMASMGGRRGRRAAAAGVTALAVAQLVSSGAGPPKEWIPHGEVEDRPNSSSYPSAHTAGAPAWPLVGALCAVPAAAVAVERVQSGAHYPSDVAAGAAIGLATAWLTPRVPNLLRRRLMPG